MHSNVTKLLLGERTLYRSKMVKIISRYNVFLIFVPVRYHMYLYYRNNGGNFAIKYNQWSFLGWTWTYIDLNHASGALELIHCGVDISLIGF